MAAYHSTSLDAVHLKRREQTADSRCGSVETCRKCGAPVLRRLRGGLSRRAAHQSYKYGRGVN